MLWVAAIANEFAIIIANFVDALQRGLSAGQTCAAMEAKKVPAFGAVIGFFVDIGPANRAFGRVPKTLYGGFGGLIHTCRLTHWSLSLAVELMVFVIKKSSLAVTPWG